jgi:hypothetical protein
MTLGGPGRSYVLKCRVEVERENGMFEEIIDFGDNPQRPRR